jgi:hypothetical protein
MVDHKKKIKKKVIRFVRKLGKSCARNIILSFIDV